MFALSRSKMSLLGFRSPRVKAQASFPNEHSFVIVVIISDFHLIWLKPNLSQSILHMKGIYKRLNPSIAKYCCHVAPSRSVLIFIHLYYMHLMQYLSKIYFDLWLILGSKHPLLMGIQICSNEGPLLFRRREIIGNCDISLIMIDYRYIWKFY